MIEDGLNTAKAKVGDTVRVHFTCTLEDGTVYDSSIGKEPLLFTIGEGSLMPGFERSVIGMHPGEIKTTRVKTVDIYGPYNQDLVKVINRSEFPDNLRPEVGLQIQIKRNDGGTSFVTLTDITETTITLDGNHPLAGKDLIFEIELIDIVKAGPSASAYFILGVFLQDKGEFDDAIKFYQKAITVDPSLTEAYYNIAVAYQKKGQFDEAITYYQQAIELNPNHEKAYLNLGISLKEKGYYEEATNFFERALQIKPDYAMAYYNLGNIFYFKGQFKEAKHFYEKVISIDPEYADAHWNISLINLLLGNFKEGWKGYEWRLKLDGLISKRDISRPLWDGSDIDGKSILIYTEQGFGDTIQFIRYIPVVAERGAKVILECQKELVPLLQNVKGIYRILENNSPLPESEFDLYCPLLSLPLIFDTTIENISSRIPYINADHSLAEKWHKKIMVNSSKLKIGIAWSGNPELLKPYYNRSCSLEVFSPLGQLHDVTFYSLQKGEAMHQAKNLPDGMQIIDYTDEIYDFSDTAAFIENLDLIISIDTAIAHLSGALGKPVWTMIPFIPDWRWMLNREDSPWYPTMKLFRQPSPGDWESVINRIKEGLKTFINKFRNHI